MTTTTEDRVVAVLRNTDFLRLWLAGGLAGTLRWLEMLAFSVFTLEVTGSPSAVALITFARLAPLIVCSLPVGALAERFERKHLLAGGLLMLALTSAALAVLAAAGRLELWHLALGATANGVFWSGEFSVRRTMAGDIVGVTHLARAMGLEAATSNATRMLGPPLGGLLLDQLGLEGVLWLGVPGYLLAAILALGIRPAARRLRPPSLGHGMAAGLGEAWRNRPVLATLAVTLVFNLFGFAYIGLVPVVGEQELGLSAFGIGILMAAEGFGSLVGSLWVGARAQPAQYFKIYSGGAVLFLLMVLVFGLSTSPLLSLASQLIAGVGLAGFAVMQSTLMLQLAPPEMRSRLMALVSLAIGAAPLGMLVIGALAEAVGAAAAIVVFAGTGLLSLGVASWTWPELWRRFSARPRAEA